jgi:hypothetical protein
MNSNGASESRLVPLGICNHNANPSAIPKVMPDTTIATGKSILCNKIGHETPD